MIFYAGLGWVRDVATIKDITVQPYPGTSCYHQLVTQLLFYFYYIIVVINVSY